MGESSCRRELRVTIEPSPEDDIVSAAKAHAANIRRTLWLKEYKRTNCRPFVAASGATTNEGSSEVSVGHSGPPSTIDGPIYTPSYWRKWQRRSKGREQRNDRSTRNDGGGNIMRHVVSHLKVWQHGKGACGTAMSGNVRNAVIMIYLSEKVLTFVATRGIPVQSLTTLRDPKIATKTMVDNFWCYQPLTRLRAARAPRGTERILV